MLNSPKATRYLLIAGYALCLLQIWLPGWYLTGDGPCHLYNAQILHDLWAGRNTDFYSRFYHLVKEPNPNWMTHILLGLLLFIVKGVVAEKILLTCYMILFISGFYRLLARLDDKRSYWPVVAVLFVFHYVLSKGFYNFSISIALLFWLIDAWFHILEYRSGGGVFWFFVLSVLTFFAHPVAFAFGALSCAALTVSVVAAAPVQAGKVRIALGRFLVQVICQLPCGLLLIRFAMGEAHDGGIVLHLAKYKLTELPDFNCLVNITGGEVLLVKLVGLLLSVMFIYGLLVRFRNGFVVHRFDGLLVSMGFACFLYLFFPDKLFGGSLFVVRMQYVWALFVVCCIGYMLPAGRVKNIGSLLLLGSFAGLSIIRFSCMQAVSEGMQDINSASGYIRPGTVLLPLDFSPGGLDAGGRLIADRNWPFCHAAEYIATRQPMIVLDNYEANTGYFPLVWRDEVNPYHYLCTNGTMEAQPPHANLAAYQDKTGVAIDYVLMWCYNDSWRSDTLFNRLYAEIEAGYRVTYRSPTGRTILWEHR